MAEYKKKPDKSPSKKNLGVFMVTDTEKALRDVKKKESEMEDDEE